MQKMIFVNLPVADVAASRAFFARHHIADYRIVESSGATEGAPATGAAATRRLPSSQSSPTPHPSAA